MKGIAPILRLLELGYWRFTTWGISPLAPHASRAVIRINALEVPL